MKIKKLILLIPLFVTGSIIFAKSNNIMPEKEKKSAHYIENKEYKKTIKSIQKNLTASKQKDKILYLLTRSFENSKQYTKAINTYNNLINNFKKSTWIQKTKFRKVNIFIKQKKYNKAYYILKNELKYILNNKRRTKLSQIYIDLAKSISFQKDKRKNNYRKALLFYNRAIKISTDKNNISQIHSIALYHYNLKEYHKAKTLLNKLIKEFPKSKLTKNANFYIGKIYQLL